ncbi:MAG: response regulator [Desulfovibrionaceae bacterium]
MSRILIAEDDRANRRLAQLVLQEAGHSVETVNDGFQALDALREGAYDLILLDIMMPGLTGFEVSETVRGSGSANASTPIIAITAYMQEFEPERFARAGFNYVISKPYAVDELKGIVAHHLR